MNLFRGRLIVFVMMLIMANGTAIAGAHMAVRSAAFNDHAPIPREYSCYGAGKSPPLAWSGVPQSAKSLALTIIDPDAPNGHFVHWIVYNLKPKRRHLPTNVAIDDLGGNARFGINGRGNVGYTGVCPPNGKHRYRITLYALDTKIDRQHATRAQFDTAIQGHVIETSVLVGLFRAP